MKNFSAPVLVSRVASFVALAAILATAACTADVTADTTPVGPSGTSTCTADSSLACITGTTGYSCTDTSQPEDADPDLVCSTDQGTGTFCCATSACNYDATVSCGSATGYSCATGAAPPDQQDSTLVCSDATTAGNVDTYCCYTDTEAAPAGATCTDDPSVSGCEPNADGTPSYGFSCTGSDNPDDDFSNITCSTPTPANGVTTFCCVYN